MSTEIKMPPAGTPMRVRCVYCRYEKQVVMPESEEVVATHACPVARPDWPSGLQVVWHPAWGGD